MHSKNPSRCRKNPQQPSACGAHCACAVQNAVFHLKIFAFASFRARHVTLLTDPVPAALLNVSSPRIFLFPRCSEQRMSRFCRHGTCLHYALLRVIIERPCTWTPKTTGEIVDIKRERHLRTPKAPRGVHSKSEAVGDHPFQGMKGCDSMHFYLPAI